jgi:hypothetical protein
MKIEGDYHANGYAGLTGLVSPEVAQAFLGLLKSDLDQSGVPLESLRQGHNLLKREAVELYAYHYPPMLMFLWGLTPTIADLTGVDLLPTYAYLRFYQRGDVCRIHQDRHACQHSVSLTLAYSDGQPWNLEVGRQRFDEPNSRVTEDFGEEDFGAVAMRPGDAVLYQGVNHRHGRITPNPNAWSAHLFMHWVDRNGPHAGHAFDGQRQYLAPIRFPVS